MSKDTIHSSIQPIPSEQYEPYSAILDEEGIKYKENQYWLGGGKLAGDKQWALHISVKAMQGPAMLKAVLPVIKKYHATFRIVKDAVFHCQVNAGQWGLNNLGKCVTIFPVSAEGAAAMVEELTWVTGSFQGIEIPGTLRIGQVIYADFFEQQISMIDGKQELKTLSYVPKKDLPFKPREVRRFKKPFRKGRLTGDRYLTIKKLGSNPGKGDRYKVIDLGRNFMKIYFIKEGKRNAVDDLSGRDIRNRLLWQQKIMTELHHLMSVPAVINFFDEDGDSYLVLEYIKGRSLHDVITAVYKKRGWRKQPLAMKKIILNYYLQVLDMAEAMHSKGYIHRDITDTNIIVSPQHRLYMVDFELAYSLKWEKPSPPFALGTLGYMAPEQLHYSIPTIYEDIFSLGAIFLFLISGESPGAVAGEDKTMIPYRLSAITGDNGLSAVIAACMNTEPAERPQISDIRQALCTFYETLI